MVGQLDEEAPLSATEQSWDEVAAWLHAEVAREFPPAWMPVAGEEIVGKVVEFNESVETKQGPVAVVTLEGPNGGRRCVWLVHRVMRREVIKTGLHLGDHLLIQCIGMTESRGGGNSYMNYKVAAHPPRRQEPNWPRVAALYKDDDLIIYEPTGPPEALTTHRTGNGDNDNPTTSTPVTPPRSDAALPPGTPLPQGDDDIPF
jgi:hypothetical protein